MDFQAGAPGAGLCPKERKREMDHHAGPDKFDRMLGALQGLPDVLSTKPSTIVATLPLIGRAQTFIVSTYRQREQGETIFLQYVDESGAIRLVIPPEVAELIARQREALAGRARKQNGKAQAPRLRQMAAERQARGELPAFLKRPASPKKARQARRRARARKVASAAKGEE
jgi:hypothetical protein